MRSVVGHIVATYDYIDNMLLKRHHMAMNRQAPTREALTKLVVEVFRPKGKWANAQSSSDES